MDGPALKKKHNSLTNYAKSRGMPLCNADDFASVSLIKIIGGRKATFKELFIDFLRENFVSRNNVDKRDVQLHHDDNEERHGSPRKVDNLEIDLGLSILDKESRAMFLLTHKWGLSSREVGYLFDLSYARVSQIVTDAEKYLHRFHENK